ncbi:PEP-utilizing enzyme [uncultured Thermomonospora sp.]|uniref:PEP-utilizing enzyme n=1 Tax=uncultured Thermomonospora sp. TaxID=671175 RepID=UPI00259B3FFC|nr:PEP-utilizing enzyme [uncultured Thermomonospora sp.]
MTSPATAPEFVTVGEGTSVLRSDEVVEGPIKWLDSPADVIEFMESGKAQESIVLSRGGTTTFMAPALSTGVRGLLTLQGMPTSHLGILAREFGIPCIMSVTFTEGVTTDRGEIIPADGTIVRLDTSGERGYVLVRASEAGH